MRTTLLGSAAALALALSACNSEPATDDLSTDVNLAEDAAANDVLGGSDGGASAVLPTDAAGFANAAAASDLYEIESAKLALQKGTSAEVKSIAQMLEREHGKSMADLKAAAAQANVTVTPALDAEKQAMIDELKAASGADFDRTFLNQQRTAHQKALLLLQNYGASGDNDALKSFAGTVQPVIEKHADALNRVPM